MHFQQERRTNSGSQDSHPLALLGDRETPKRHRRSSEEPWGQAEKERYVLIVEDEPDALEAMAEWLADEGFPSLQARHGKEALDLLRAGRRPALILLDIQMPVMDGNEFLRQIASDPELAELPIAVVTASAVPTDVVFRRNNAGFFLKPVDHERLLRTIRSYCG